MVQSKSRKKKAPKRVLALPDLEQAKTAVLNNLTSASGQRTYDHAIREFVGWYCSEPRLAFNRRVVLRYRIHLEQRGYAPATINLRLAAVRRVAYEAADAGLLSPELAAAIRRVRGVRRIGVRLGNPIPTWAKAAVDAWTSAAGIADGAVFRAINKAGRVGATACRPRCSGMLSAPRRLAPPRGSSRSYRRLSYDVYHRGARSRSAAGSRLGERRFARRCRSSRRIPDPSSRRSIF